MKFSAVEFFVYIFKSRNGLREVSVSVLVADAVYICVRSTPITMSG